MSGSAIPSGGELADLAGLPASGADSPAVVALDGLYLAGARFRTVGGNLVIRPAALLTPEAAGVLRQGKAEALAVVLAAEALDDSRPIPTPPPPRCLTPDCKRYRRPMAPAVAPGAWLCLDCGSGARVAGAWDAEDLAGLGDQEGGDRNPGERHGNAAGDQGGDLARCKP